jgi:hypothetical protein
MVQLLYGIFDSITSIIRHTVHNLSRAVGLEQLDQFDPYFYGLPPITSIICLPDECRMIVEYNISMMRIVGLGLDAW